MFPILLQFGPLKIFSYGFFVALGFFLTLRLVVSQVGEIGIDKKIIYDLGLYILISAILGSRLFHILFNLGEYLAQPLSIFYFWEGGLFFHGGLIAALIVAIIFLKKKKLNLGQVADILAPGLVLGYVFGRIGCFFAGCCYGKETNLPWAVTFHHQQSLAPTNISLHPTQLYSAGANFILFLYLWWRKNKPHYAGELFWQYLIGYSGTRFILEFFRADERGIIFGLPFTQVLSLLIFFLAIFIEWKRRLSLPKQVNG
jgi:phosphatidylglycerol:prolipoprotein diacylglycerol transferase